MNDKVTEFYNYCLTAFLENGFSKEIAEKKATSLKEAFELALKYNNN